MVEDSFHGVGQHVAVFLAQLDLAPGQWIGVAATADPEEGQGAGVFFFQVLLGKPGVVAAPLEELHRRVVASIAEDHRPQFAIRRRYAEDRHVVIDRPAEGRALLHEQRHFFLFVVPPINGKSGGPHSHGQSGWFQIVQCRADRLDRPVAELVGVGPDLLGLFGRHVVHVGEVVAEDRAAVSVRAGEHELLARQAGAFLDLFGNRYR